ncbi:MAG: hypothetical protein WDL87_10385 [Candidatus Omnitrophota bacterium]|jgi:hypothetical protein
MPNYEIVSESCNLKKKKVVMSATYVEESLGIKKLLRHIQDCMSKDAECKQLDCKYDHGSKDPLALESTKKP